MTASFSRAAFRKQDAAWSPPNGAESGVPNRDYLPGIEGLRAIAVLTVMIYHLNPAMLPGGFVGVDIFFVISGFVVTGSMLRDSGLPFLSFIGAFYARRFVRILPALVVCLCATVAANIAFIPDAWLSGAVQKTGIAAFFGVSNFALIWTNDGYFSPRAELNPFTHTWSLAVEEQFYAFFPLFLYSIVLGQKGLRRGGIFLLMTLCLASLTWAVYASSSTPEKAFYLLSARFWELGLGSILWLIGGKLRTTVVARVGRSQLMTCGLALIVLSAVAADPSQFPFPWALPAVAGSAVLLLATASETPECLTDEVLTTPAIRTVGNMSYSLYLWHWPIYTIMRWTVGLDGAATFTVAVSLAFLLAWLSYRFVEQPTRKLKASRANANRWVVATGLSIVSAIGGTVWYAYQNADSLRLTVVSRDRARWYPIGPGPLATENIRCAARRVQESEDTVKFLPYECGSQPAWQGHRLFVLGDSHAGAYQRLFDSIVRLSGGEIDLYTKSGCGVPGISQPTGTYELGCQQLLARFKADVAALARPGDLVFLPALRVPRIEMPSFDVKAALALASSENQRERRIAESEALELFGEFALKGVKIILEMPTPVLPAPPFRCADWFNRMNPACRGGFLIDRTAMERLRSDTVWTMRSIAAGKAEVSLWDPMETLCSSTTCSGFDEDGPLFFDGDHLSGHGNDRLVPSFLAHMSTLLRNAGIASSFARDRHQPPASGNELKYNATLQDGIDFRTQGYPDYVASVSGLSKREDWGRWSDARLGDLALTFKLPLPERFTLALTIRAIGPNEGRNIELRIGQFHQFIKVGYQPETLTIEVDNPGSSNVIELIPYLPILGSKLNPGSSDDRLLGIGLVALRIRPTTNVN